MIERINDFAAGHFGGVGTTRGSLVRIHAWVAVCLLLASIAASPHALNAKQRRRRGPVEVVAANVNDQRAFLPSPFGSEYFHIAWIAGSEDDVYTAAGRTQFVAREVQPLLPEIDGRKVVVDLYYLPGMRVGDEYFTLLDALAAKPDMIMMSFNPVWTLNPLAIHHWDQLDSKAAAQLVSKPSAWPIAASLLSPSDLAWGLAAKLAPIENRSYYSQKIHDIVDELGPLDRRKLASLTYQASLKPDRYTAVLTDTALGFWLKQRFDEPPINPYYAANNHGMTAHRWAQWTNKSNQLDNGLNKVILHDIGRALGDSHIPSYVYLAQMNSDWLATNADIQRATRGVELQLQHAADDFDAPTVRFQPKTVTRFTSGLHFLPGDPVHTDRTGSLPAYLARQLCGTLNQSGNPARCTAIKRGA